MYRNHIILDFEMNPVSSDDADASRHLGREIIEIGAVKLNESFAVSDHFQCYIKPQYNGHICGNIRELTGIGFDQTHEAENFVTALSLFTAWIGMESSRIYSWSNSDFNQLRTECEFKGVAFPPNMLRWVDLQAIFPRMLKQRSYRHLSLANAAKVCGVNMDPSKAHGALYDAEITAELLIPFLDGSYRNIISFQQERICKEVSHSSYSLAQASGGALQRLLGRLVAAECPCSAN